MKETKIKAKKKMLFFHAKLTIKFKTHKAKCWVWHGKATTQTHSWWEGKNDKPFLWRVSYFESEKGSCLYYISTHVVVHNETENK